MPTVGSKIRVSRNITTIGGGLIIVPKNSVGVIVEGPVFSMEETENNKLSTEGWYEIEFKNLSYNRSLFGSEFVQISEEEYETQLLLEA